MKPEYSLSDEQIDQLLQPLIAGTRDLWAASGDGERPATNGISGHGVPGQEAMPTGDLAPDHAAPKG